MEDADGYYGGAHNFYVYDQGKAGYVWLLDHTDSALEWVSLFTGLGVAEHPIYWWAGRPLPDAPAELSDPSNPYVNGFAKNPRGNKMMTTPNHPPRTHPPAIDLCLRALDAAGRGDPLPSGAFEPLSELGP